MAGRPRQRLLAAHAAADHGVKFLDAQRLQQPPLDLHDVVHRDRRERRPERPAGRGVGAPRPRRAATPAQGVRADHEVPTRVHELPRPDQQVPPARRVVGVVPRDVRVAADRVADQHRVVSGVAQCSEGLVANLHAIQPPAGLQLQRRVERERPRVRQPARAAGVVGRGEVGFGSLGHRRGEHREPPPRCNPRLAASGASATKVFRTALAPLAAHRGRLIDAFVRSGASVGPVVRSAPDPVEPRAERAQQVGRR